MSEKEVVEQLILEISEELQIVNTKKDNLLYEESKLRIKCNMLNELSKKLRTDILEKVEQELKQLSDEIIILENSGYDLRMLECHIKAKYHLEVQK